MNTIHQFTAREKFLVFLIILLGVFLLTGWQPGQAANSRLTRYTDKELYAKAVQSSEQGDLVRAGAYLYAYIQRNPEEYAKNIAGRRDIVDSVFQNWMRTVLSYQTLARETDMQIASCNQYPCKENESDVVVMFSRVFPADMVMVCEDINYKGKCSYLALGEYTHWQDLGVRNDSISSVRVGSNVKVLLCVHYLALTSDCLEFTRDDNNLLNNYLPGKSHSLNDNISTARVTYRPGKGLTLP